MISDAADLAKFLAEAAREGGDLEKWAADEGRGLCNRAACEAAEAGALAGIANRPPPGLVIRKFGSRSLVGSVSLPESPGDVMLKYYYPAVLPRRIAYTLTGSRCRQSWVAGLAFLQLGIPAPAPLAMAEWKAGGVLISKSFLATRRVGGVGLDEFVSAHREDEARLKQTAISLAEAFSRMARYRIAHGDLKAGNILAGDDGTIFFADLDAVTFLAPSAVWKARRRKDREKFADNWRKFPAAAEIFRKALSEE